MGPLTVHGIVWLAINPDAAKRGSERILAHAFPSLLLPIF
jgi:hypothetical protein